MIYHRRNTGEGAERSVLVNWTITTKIKAIPDFAYREKMIDDLLDLITDASILVISTEYSGCITNILETNDYQYVQCCNNIQTAMSLHLSIPFDLIIISSMEGLTDFELMDKITSFNSKGNIPPVFLINGGRNKPPVIDSVIKDFINMPIDEDEFLFRIHRLLTDHLTHLELINHNESIVKAIEQRSKALRESQIEVIECLGYAAEFRDSETGMHTIRVGHYSQCLAKAMGMNDKEAESLLYSAPMHDVGKIGIPDNILLKPGRLEGKEWEIMKQHTVIGGNILNRSNNKLLRQASVIALSHHEKWDGSGYPLGLKGNDIHLYGRIVAIVDVFDALTMERPYKKAWTIDNALELINSESGKHFDPSLVKLFNDNFEDILNIKSAYADKSADDNLLDEYLAY